MKNINITIDHHAGFFSNCNVRLCRIVECWNKFNILPKVDSSKQWTFYRSFSGNGDITSAFFKEINDIDLCIEKNIKIKDFQFSDYSDINFNSLKPFIIKYFSTSDTINNIKENLIEQYNINLDKTIGVCYRSGDKCTETTIPSYDDVLTKIKELKQKYPDHKIIIQSDVKPFYDFVNKYFQNKDIIVFNEVFKLEKDDKTSVQYKIPVNERIDQAQLFLAIMKIMSKCSKVIINSGNVGLWICFFRSNIKGVYQYISYGKEEIDKIEKWKFNKEVY